MKKNPVVYSIHFSPNSTGNIKKIWNCMLNESVNILIWASFELRQWSSLCLGSAVIFAEQPQISSVPQVWPDQLSVLKPEPWMNSERFVNDQWTLGERTLNVLWIVISSKLWTQNAKLWTINAHWAHSEQTVKERKNLKVERFRDCIYMLHPTVSPNNLLVTRATLSSPAL